MKGSIPVQTAFIAPATLRPEEVPRSTQFWIGSSGSEAMVPRGSIPGGTSVVTVPGMGSLSVTGPTGNRGGGGAKPYRRLNSVASEQKRPPTSELRQGSHEVTGGEVLSTEGQSQTNSGNKVSRRGAIIILEYL